MLGYPVQERIYVADNLTRKNAEIRRVAGKMKKDGKLHHYSVFKGEVNVIVSEGQRQQRVKSVDELEELVGFGGINNRMSNMDVSHE